MIQTVDLSGRWTLRQAGTKQLIRASVPGCVHTDLRAAGLIEDPYYRDNASRLQWIGKTDWIYSRTFTVPPSCLEAERVLLACDGLDTVATIRVNGRLVGQTKNMHRTYEFDVQPLLRPGENSIEVRFDSAFRYVEKSELIDDKPHWAFSFIDLELFKGKTCGVIRKEACNFGWDWGPTLITCGIWRPMRLVAVGQARLTDVHIRQEHGRRGAVRLAVQAAVERFGRSACRMRTSVRFRGKEVACIEEPVTGKRGRAELAISDPVLWWPNRLGEQPLYDVTVALLDGEGKCLDTQSKRIGLRTVRLVRKRDKQGESFGFTVNGIPIFAKGADWIPADTFITRVSAERYERLVRAAAAANMNMLRVWGGGVYEDERFYDLCDELGILVWQDFMYACTMYPHHDAEFTAECVSEAEGNIRRLRHHPCMALWCGNNEIEWQRNHLYGKDYERFFHKILPEIVSKHDPDIAYWPGSPSTPLKKDRHESGHPGSGDAHTWNVWGGGERFEWFRTSTHRFCSEFGFQSFPAPRTVHGYTAPEDRNIGSYVMDFHQRAAGSGNPQIMRYLLEWFRLPNDFDMTLWVSQILQGIGIKYAVEHWRRSPHTQGALYWQHNDTWPGPTWASIDYHGRWKALHYMAKRFFAPRLISAVEDMERGTVEVHVSNDMIDARKAAVRWELTSLEGAVVAAGKKPFDMPANRSRRVQVLNLKRHLKEHGPRNLLLWLDLAVRGKIVSDNLVLFERPGKIDLPDPELRATVKADEDGFQVAVKAKHPALYVWLELDGTDAAFSENFFCLRPGTAATVRVHPEARLSVKAFKAALRVRSLVDTYRA